MATIKGSNRSEDLFGSNKSDTIKGNGGNDFIEGGLGSDKLDGGIGDDYIRGYGWSQDETLHVNDPPEWGIIKSTNDNDFLGGGAGNDILIDWWGNNKLDGGDGNDSLDAGSGKDTLIGGRGTDFMSGGPGEDLYIPGMGDDIIDDQNWNWSPEGDIDYFSEGGEPDADIFLIERNLGPVGHDVIYGYDGSGVDRIQIDGYTAAETQIIDTPDGLITTFAFTDGSWLEVHSTSPLGGSWDFV